MASKSDRIESLEASLLAVKEQEAVSTTPPRFYCKNEFGKSSKIKSQIKFNERQAPTNSSGIPFCWRHGASKAGSKPEVSHVAVILV